MERILQIVNSHSKKRLEKKTAAANQRHEEREVQYQKERLEAQHGSLTEATSPPTAAAASLGFEEGNSATATSVTSTVPTTVTSTSTVTTTATTTIAVTPNDTEFVEDAGFGEDGGDCSDPLSKGVEGIKELVTARILTILNTGTFEEVCHMHSYNLIEESINYTCLHFIIEIYMSKDKRYVFFLSHIKISFVCIHTYLQKYVLFFLTPQCYCTTFNFPV